MAINDSIVTDHSDLSNRPTVSREMALYWLNGMHEQQEQALCVALAAQAYQESRNEDSRSPVIDSLLDVIKQITQKASSYNCLKDMLETLPKEEE